MQVDDKYDTIIKLDNDNIEFEKPRWFKDELELGASIGMKWDGVTVRQDIKRLSKLSLFIFMRKSFSKWMKEDKYRGSRAILFSELSETYKIYNDNFLTHAKEVLPFYKDLYEHQLESIQLMCYRRHNLLSLEQGLGKTVTAIAVTMMLDLNRTLIVCPAICKWNWVEELIKWGIDPQTISVLDSKKDIISSDERFIVINYDMLKSKSKLIGSNIDHMILDECHYIKNTKSQRYKNLAKLKSLTNAKVSLLTGTPVKNKVDDLFAYLCFTNHPLGLSYRSFIEEYTFYYETSYGINIRKGRNLKHLNAMMSNFLIRKRKEECLDLPEKIIKKYYFELEDYREEYRKAIKELVLRSSNINNIDINASIHTMNILITKSKLKNIVRLIEDMVGYDEKKVVVYTSYKEPFDFLVDRFKGMCVGIDGSVPTSKRKDYIKKFKEDPECKVFIGNMVAAGVGINLENANDVIFCNLPFTSTELEQCMDRLHRIGQNKNVNVYYTICKDTIDENIFGLIEKKAGDIAHLLDGKSSSSDFQNLPQELFKILLNGT